MADEHTPDRLPWTTPRLELIGTMEDVQAGGGQADVDVDYEPGIAAS